MQKNPPLEYQDYLNLDQLLACQRLKSEEAGEKAHDEMLFIIVHQVYELWFKQILTEIDSVAALFKAKKIGDNSMGTVVSRLQRIIEIQGVLIQQIHILETMTPLDFLEFRDLLFPASGFQSVQNRLIENKLGLRPDQRLRLNQGSYESFIDKKYRDTVIQSQEDPSLFQLVEKWLERTPFLSVEGFNFWQEYRTAVTRMLEKDRRIVEKNPRLSDSDKKRNYKELDNTLKTFEALFDEAKYTKLLEKGAWRFSFKALHAALFIHIYRDEPALQMPFKLLQTLIDIDENFTTWRYRHSLMAHRMLGRKIGTGGSAGHDYLKQATDQHKIFSDLFNLTTFFIPRSQRPNLPNELKTQLSFCYAQ